MYNNYGFFFRASCGNSSGMIQSLKSFQKGSPSAPNYFDRLSLPLKERIFSSLPLRDLVGELMILPQTSQTSHPLYRFVALRPLAEIGARSLPATGTSSRGRSRSTCTGGGASTPATTLPPCSGLPSSGVSTTTASFRTRASTVVRSCAKR